MTGSTSSATTNAGSGVPEPEQQQPEDRVDDQRYVRRQVDEVEEEVLRVAVPAHQDPDRHAERRPPRRTRSASCGSVSQKLTNTVPAAMPSLRVPRRCSPTSGRPPRPGEGSSSNSVARVDRRDLPDEQEGERRRAASTRRPSAAYSPLRLATSSVNGVGRVSEDLDLGVGLRRHRSSRSVAYDGIRQVSSPVSGSMHTWTGCC